MRHVAPAVDASEVLTRLQRGVIARTLRPIRPVKTERIWLPVWLIGIGVRLRGTLSTMRCSVDALSGSFGLFEMNEALRPGEPEGECIPFILDASEAERRARDSLVTFILRRRSQSGKPVPGETLSIEALRWPYWVVYHRRRSEQLDMALLDAATGRPAGVKIKLAVLDAFRAAESPNLPDEDM